MNRKHTFHPAIVTMALATLLLVGAQARTWTSADGTKTFEGELKSYDEATGSVVVTVPGGSTRRFKQDVLSADDIAWLKTEGSKPKGGGPSVAVQGKVPDALPDPDDKEADMSKPVQVIHPAGTVQHGGPWQSRVS